MWKKIQKEYVEKIKVEVRWKDLKNKSYGTNNRRKEPKVTHIYQHTDNARCIIEIYNFLSLSLSLSLSFFLSTTRSSLNAWKWGFLFNTHFKT